jgi:hypothetical protein
MATKFYAIILCIVVATITTAAQTSEFTYHGKLGESGNPANATYEMQFRLFDNANAGQGTQQGTTVTKSAVVVWGGTFDVSLDFGAAPFAGGAERYLEVSIRPVGGTGAYTAIATREKLTSGPYALKSPPPVTAETATNGDQLGSGSGNQSDARLPDLRKEVDELRSAVEAQKAQIEGLRLLLFCRTTMRPELCREEQ